MRRDSLIVRDPTSYVANTILAFIVYLFKLRLCEWEIKFAWAMAFAIILGTSVNGPLDLHSPHIICDEHVVFGHWREHALTISFFDISFGGCGAIRGFVAERMRAHKLSLNVSHVSHFVDIIL